ncbi:hypothetical protein HYH02_006455 [Chlamydomonas schloesseri]|uniref:Ubiquitin-like domain-containing protein n=1 Tax=Chlamydomonas schloesseri TaxID=2026947 RepID=A0A835WJV0_9CHLO|nr:hypothetical protein HYH02_006455 [Chlamydomonas schloesseri]|eukprot:KAG2448564.1 hypothetical protein HYH02_006455 [Chlamydomonas schloesseri]
MTALHMRTAPAASAGTRHGRGRFVATAAAPRPLATRTALAAASPRNISGRGAMGLPRMAAPLQLGAPAVHCRSAPPRWAAAVVACLPQSAGGEPPEMQAGKQGPRSVSVTLGTGAKLQLQLPATATIGDLKSQLQQRTGLEPQQQKLLFGAQSALPDTTTLGALSAKELSEVVLITRLRGG